VLADALQALCAELLSHQHVGLVQPHPVAQLVDHIRAEHHVASVEQAHQRVLARQVCAHPLNYSGQLRDLVVAVDDGQTRGVEP
jgi:hypothetical protein